MFPTRCMYYLEQHMHCGESHCCFAIFFVSLSSKSEGPSSSIILGRGHTSLQLRATALKNSQYNCLDELKHYWEEEPIFTQDVWETFRWVWTGSLHLPGWDNASKQFHCSKQSVLQHRASLWQGVELRGSQPQPPLAEVFFFSLTGSQLPVAMVSIEDQQVKERGRGGIMQPLTTSVCVNTP